MIIYSIIKLQSVRKQNVYLLVLFGLLSCQQIEASKSGFVPGKPPKPPKPGESAKSVESAKFGEHGRMAKIRGAAKPGSMELNLNGPSKSGQTVQGLSPVQKNLVNRTANLISSTFMSAARTVDYATGGFPGMCNKVIGKPLMKAWLKMRQLEIKPDQAGKGIDLNYSDMQLQAKQSSDQVEVGLMNKKIDKIIDSVVNMYNNGLSPKEIGTFVKNSVELALVTPVVGMGAGAGAFVGGVSLGAGGAVAGAGMGALSVPFEIAFITGGVAPAGMSMAGGFVGGAYGTGVGAFEGASAGARHTSNFLQKPITTVKNMGVEAWNAPEYLGNKYFSSKSTVKDGNKQPNPKKQTNNKSFQQTSSAGNNSSQGNQSAAQ